MIININKRQTNKYSEEMTELVNQLVEEIKDAMPKYVYVVHKKNYIMDNYEVSKTAYRIKKEAFKEVFGIEKEGELNRWYNIDLYNNKKVVRMKVE